VKEGVAIVVCVMLFLVCQEYDAVNYTLINQIYSSPVIRMRHTTEVKEREIPISLLKNSRLKRFNFYKYYLATHYQLSKDFITINNGNHT
jgi:broad specificity phosphatase PhoE